MAWSAHGWNDGDHILYILLLLPDTNKPISNYHIPIEFIIRSQNTRSIPPEASPWVEQVPEYRADKAAEWLHDESIEHKHVSCLLQEIATGMPSW